MLSRELNIFEYEEVLTGRRSDFYCSFKGTFKENCVEVGNVWRYAIEHILKWTPKQAEVYLTEDIVKQLCLNKTFPAINFDPAHMFIQDYRFVLQYAFPEEIRFDMREQTIDIYERRAKKGKYAHSPESYTFPKRFFVNNDGIERAEILMRYVVNLYLGGQTMKELYRFFGSDPLKATRWLQIKKLGVPIKQIYDSPLDYFHSSRPYALKDWDLFYNYVIRDKAREIMNKKKSESGTETGKA